MLQMHTESGWHACRWRCGGSLSSAGFLSGLSTQVSSVGQTHGLSSVSMILSLCQWAQSTAFFTAIRGSWNVYPVIMATHLLGIALFGGMILMTDMRLLGWAMRGRSLSDVVDQLRIPKRVGLLIVVTCGI